MPTADYPNAKTQYMHLERKVVSEGGSLIRSPQPKTLDDPSLTVGECQVCCQRLEQRISKCRVILLAAVPTWSLPKSPQEQDAWWLQKLNGVDQEWRS